LFMFFGLLFGIGGTFIIFLFLSFSFRQQQKERVKEGARQRVHQPSSLCFFKQ
jgi:hypothetical protein